MKNIFFLAFVSSTVLLFASGCTCGENFPCSATPAPRKVMGASEKMTYEAACDGCISNGAPAMKDNFKSPDGRQMAFTAQITLNVSDVKEAVGQTRNIALKAGGYVKRLDDDFIVVAIPVNKADEVIKNLGKTGVVASLRVEGEDVTESIIDVDVRLENLKKSRERLLDLMKKADKVDEMLKVEKELTRITTEIERLEGTQKNLKSKVDFVTVTIHFSQLTMSIPANSRVPVQWINELGDDLLNGDETLYPSDEKPLFCMELPNGFVFNGRNMALSGDNSRIRFNEYANAMTKSCWYENSYAETAFYAPMIEKVLKEKFDCDVEKISRKIDEKDGVVFTVKPVFGEKPYVFCVAAVADGDTVKVISVSSTEDAFRNDFPNKTFDDFISSVRF